MQLNTTPSVSQHIDQIEAPHEFREKLIAFSLAFFLFFALSQLKNVTTFPFDSGGYWRLSNLTSFFGDAKNIRGYVYPLILFPSRSLAEVSGDFGHYPYRIASSLIYAFLLTNLLPSFYQRIFGGTISIGRRLVVPLFMATLMPGLIIYPLSDLPALLMLIGSIYMLFRFSSSGHTGRSMLMLILAGVLAGAAYNTRTIYIFSVACILLSIPLILLARQLPKTRILATLAFIAGLAVVSAPQALINIKIKGRFTPLVISSITGESLFAQQLLWGITMQRYETSIDPSAPAPTRIFHDMAGAKLLGETYANKRDLSIPAYFSLLAKHPLDFAGIYGRHIVNGLDLRDGDVYVADDKRATNAASLAGFLSLFACFVIVLRNLEIQMVNGKKLRGNIASYSPATYIAPSRRYWYVWLGICLLPVVAIVPGAIETRFFAPVYLLVFSTIAFCFNAREFWEYCRLRRGFILTFFLSLLVLFFSISLTTQASLRYTL